MAVEISHQGRIVATPGSPPVPIAVRVTNTSSIVESYEIEVVNAPAWLITDPRQLQLYPGTTEEVQLNLSIAPENLVPVQSVSLLLRVQGESEPALRLELSLDVEVGAVIGPVRVSLEPGMLRGHDSTTALFRVRIDNTRSNVPMTFELSGKDSEHVAAFSFAPERIEVLPTSTTTARLRVDSPLPPAGEKVQHTLTVTAGNGTQELEATCTFLQSTAAPIIDPPVSLELDPSVVRVHGGTGRCVVMVDNQLGSRPQLVRLHADDDENAVRFGISPGEMTVPAGQRRSATIILRADPPPGGQSSSRDFTVVSSNSRETAPAKGTFIQETVNRRPLARILLTLLGSAIMMWGIFLPWTADPDRSIMDWNYSTIAEEVQADYSVDEELAKAETWLREANLFTALNLLVNIGIVPIILTLLALLGLAGTTGWLTRASAVLGAIFAVVFLILTNTVLHVTPAESILVFLLGCVVTFIGGLFARRTT